MWEKRKGEKDRLTPEVSLIDMSDRLTEEYLDKYKGMKSELLNTTRFDENSYLNKTYLGKQT